MAQQDFLLGEWKFEKIPDYVEIDEKGLKIANEFFKDITLSFDQNNYNYFIMGKTETGTWTFISKNTFEFNSTKGYKYEVEIKRINDHQIIYKKQNVELQLIKSSEKAILAIKEPILDKINGVDIDKEKLLGIWYHNGQIVGGKEIGLILKHNESEIANYTFLKDGKFINKLILDTEFTASWKIAEDNQTLIIISNELTEFLKVVRLSANELHLYNPKNESIIKFKK